MGPPASQPSTSQPSVGQPATPPGAQPATPPATQPETAPQGAAAGQPAQPTRDPQAAAAAQQAMPPAVAPAQVMVSVPSADFRVNGGPYTVPISISNASRVSVMSVTVTYNPAALRVRTVQEGTFMRQGGVTPTFSQRPDAATGRVDISVARSGDPVGASGSGLIAAIMFDAIAPGQAPFAVSGVATAPDGSPVPLTFTPAGASVK
jgi:general secretion pathway protein D